MNFTKEQTQTITLLVLVGLIVAVGSYMGMIKPNLGRAKSYEENVNKWQAEIGEQQRVVKGNLDTVHRARTIEARTTELEAGLRHGLLAGRLTGCFEELMRAHGFNFRFQNDLEQIEVLNGGQYHELSNVFTIMAIDFYELVGFIQVLETTNPGIRISSLEIKAYDPQNPSGRVQAQLEVHLIGFKDGRDEAWESASVNTFKPERRNPFTPPGLRGIDPYASLRDRLGAICFNGTMGQGSAFLRPAPEAAAELVKAGDNLPFFDEPVRLVRFSSRALIVYHEPSQVYFKLLLHTSGPDAGRVKQVEEITHE
jgi:hypothetical protein